MEDYTSDHGKPSKRILSMFEIIESFVLAIVCVILVFVFFAKLSIVEGESMEDIRPMPTPTARHKRAR